MGKLAYNVGFVGVRGLPARYGAFDVLASQLFENRPRSVKIHVGCAGEVYAEAFDPDCVRYLIPRFQSGIGSLLFSVSSFCRCYFGGCRIFVFFGYSLGPLFLFMRALGVSGVINMDGLEYQRSKWGLVARAYFRMAEWCAVKSSLVKISDSYALRQILTCKYPGHHFEVIKYGADFGGNFQDLFVAPNDHVDLGREIKSVRKSYGLYPRYVILVMRLEPENNIELIVDSFIAANCSDLQLVIVGPSTKYFEKIVVPKIEAAPFSDIRVVGAVYCRRTLGFLRFGAVGYIHGHSVGGTNPTLVEACYVGKPIIAFDTVFNREVCGDKATYFKGQNSLITAIVELEGAGEVGRHCTLSLDMGEYGWDSIVEKYWRLIGGKLL